MEDSETKTNWKCDWTMRGDQADDYWREFGSLGWEQPPMLEPEFAEIVTQFLMFLNCALTLLSFDENTGANTKLGLEFLGTMTRLAR